MIRTLSQIHNFNTRNRSDFAVEIANTQLGANNFYIRALISFNRIPNVIKNARSIGSFKKKTKEFLIELFINEQQ